MELDNINYDHDYSILPPHIVSIILSHLDFEDLKNAVQVSSLWYYASHHPLITNRIRLRISKNIKLEIPDISQIIRPFDAVRVSHVDFDMIEYKEFFVNFGKCIKTINIAFCNINVRQLYEVLINMRNLENFEFFESKPMPLKTIDADQLNTFDESDRNKIMNNLGKIKYLTISPSSNNLLSFIPIFQYTKNVEKLRLRNTWASLPINNELILNNLFEMFDYWNLEKLKSLEIEFISKNKNNLFYEKFLKLKNIQLKELRMIEKYDKEHNFNSNFYNQGFTNFCILNKNLDILEIPSINDQELYDISRNISNLKHLEVGTMRADRIQEIRNLKSLNVLHLCRFIGTVEESVQLFSVRFDNLKDLWLELFIDKVVLDLIAENCENLEALSLNLVTTECESIFKKLLKLKYLRVWFRRFRFHHFGDQQIDQNVEFNITNLQELEYLEINGYVPGIAANQIESLPKLKNSNHKYFNYDQSSNNVGFEHIYDDDDSEVERSDNSEQEFDIEDVVYQ